METIKREITPEIRAKLLGFAPVSMKRGVPYTPAMYGKDPELADFAPVFWQRGWTEDEKNSLMQAAKGEKTSFDQKLMKNMARVTLLNMENVIDISTGESIAFVDDGKGSLSPDVFNGFPFALQMDLFYHAQKISGMGGVAEEDTESLKS